LVPAILDPAALKLNQIRQASPNHLAIVFAPYLWYS